MSSDYINEALDFVVVFVETPPPKIIKKIKIQVKLTVYDVAAER